MGRDLDHSQHGMLDDGYWSTYTSEFTDYDLGQTIGYGASSIVYSAICRCPVITLKPETHRFGPSNGNQKNPSDREEHGNSAEESVRPTEEKECAIKVSSQHPDVELFFKESRLLSLCRHPNVLRNLATFTLPPDHQRIALVTPLISGGSLAGILDWRSRVAATSKASYRHHLPRLRIRKKDEDDYPCMVGLQEEEIKAVVKQVLDGLAYLHRKGFIHRDLKAGNLLVEKDGTIMLADFGVGGDVNDDFTPLAPGRPGADQLHFHESTCFPSPGIMQRAARPPLDNAGKRRSFVGTPNWMAPEVILGMRYDGKADIWSLGITIIELASGIVPGSRDKQSKVLSRTVTDPAPTLDRSSGAFSRAMKDFVDDCLIKDPQLRPSAEVLVEHAWLRGARGKTYLAQSLFSDLPPLGARQEIRRVPSMSSMNSRASSWDFANSPSIPSTPMRSSFYLPVRSPSLLSYADDSHAVLHSRNASRNSTLISSVPPSPHISLRRWAERTASEHEEGSWSRSASETGRQRSTPIRRRPSVPLDQDRNVGIEGVPAPRARRMPSVEGGVGMGILFEAVGPSPVRSIGHPAREQDHDPTSQPDTHGAPPTSSLPDGIDGASSPEMSRVSTATIANVNRSSQVEGHRAVDPARSASDSGSPSTRSAIAEGGEDPVAVHSHAKAKGRWWSRRPKEDKTSEKEKRDKEETRWPSLSRKPTVKKGEAR